MDHTIRIGIVDENAMFRKILHSTIGMQPGIKVVGEAEDGSSAIAMVKRHIPEIVLMDISPNHQV